MLRRPLAQTETPSNNLNSHHLIPFLHHRPNETTGYSDMRTNTNGLYKRIPMVCESSTNLPSHQHTPGMGTDHVLMQSRSSEPTLAASVALAHQTSSQNQFQYGPSNSSQDTMFLAQVNGGGSQDSDASHASINHNDCRARYDRLLEAHRKLQRTNGALEGRLYLTF